MPRRPHLIFDTVLKVQELSENLFHYRGIQNTHTEEANRTMDIYADPRAGELSTKALILITTNLYTSMLSGNIEGNFKSHRNAFVRWCVVF
jgi:hypothetical protein